MNCIISSYEEILHTHKSVGKKVVHRNVNRYHTPLATGRGRTSVITVYI